MNEELMRGIMATHASGVAVVAARAGSHDVAMTISSLVSVSLEPPTILFTAYSDSRFAEAVQEGSYFAISILGAEGLADARWLSEPGRPLFGQLKGTAHSRAQLSEAAILDSAVAHLECQTRWVKAAGSHDVVVGEVLAGQIHTQNQGYIVHHLAQLRAVQ